MFKLFLQIISFFIICKFFTSYTFAHFYYVKKTPTLLAVMNCKGNSYHALEICEDVKYFNNLVQRFLIYLRNKITICPLNSTINCCSKCII